MSNNIESFSELKEYIKYGLNILNSTISLKPDFFDYDLNRFIDEIKKEFINALVDKANYLNIENIHIGNYGNYTEDNKRLWALDRLDDIEKFLNNYFSKFDKSDRIKQLMPKIDVLHMLKPEGAKYFWYSELKRDFSPENVAQKLLSMSQKRIRLYSSISADRLKELLKLLYNIDLNTGTYKDSLDTQEYLINQSGIIKVKYYSKCIYITFIDNKLHNDFLKRLINDVIDYMKSTN